MRMFWPFEEMEFLNVLARLIEETLNSNLSSRQNLWLDSLSGRCPSFCYPVDFLGNSFVVIKYQVYNRNCIE